MRKTNTNCCICNKAVYRRPWEISNRKIYCSKECVWIDRGLIPEKICPICKKVFKPEKRNRKTCSKRCSNINRRGISYSNDSTGNQSKQRLNVIKNTFGLTHCMIDGCDYNRTYDIHRHISGKNGGKYEIGNMFAICPKHHAEITRKIIEVEKVNDYTLKIVKENLEEQANLVMASNSNLDERNCLMGSTPISSSDLMNK